MAEGEKKSFFEKFGGEKRVEISGDRVSPEELLLEIEKDQPVQPSAEEVAGPEALAEETPTSEENSGEKVSAEPVLEVGESHQELVDKPEYWAKLVESIRREKLSEDEVENKELQSEKILKETLRVLVAADEEEIKKGNGIKTVDFFEKTIFPIIEKDEPGINKDEYLDQLHALLSQVDGIKDPS